MASSLREAFTVGPVQGVAATSLTAAVEPRAARSLSPRIALPVAAVVAVGIVLWAFHLAGSAAGGSPLAISLVLGALFGLLLQRSRFCFFCISRDFVERRDARGLLGLVTALAVGTLGYHAVFGAFLPDPGIGRLPPDAHIGPVSWVLAAGAAAFGIGMAVSGSCISAHLYRLGEGATASPFALLGALLGFALGFATWNPLYLQAVQAAPVVWLPSFAGYGASLLLQLAALALVAWLLVRYSRSQPAEASAGTPSQALWRRRWPTYVGGCLIGMLGAIAYFRVGPLGVTAELGSVSRTLANAASLLPARLEGLDGFSGCATVIKDALLSENGVFVAGLVLAAFASALVAGDFRPARPTAGAIARNLAGGILMGWGAMVALGCTVGTLLSGIMAGALSGWVFWLFCSIGMLLGMALRNRLPKGAEASSTPA